MTNISLNNGDIPNAETVTYLGLHLDFQAGQLTAKNT